MIILQLFKKNTCLIFYIINTTENPKTIEINYLVDVGVFHTQLKRILLKKTALNSVVSIVIEESFS